MRRSGDDLWNMRLAVAALEAVENDVIAVEDRFERSVAAHSAARELMSQAGLPQAHGPDDFFVASHCNTSLARSTARVRCPRMIMAQAYEKGGLSVERPIYRAEAE